jgi:hypothetical protein
MFNMLLCLGERTKTPSRYSSSPHSKHGDGSCPRAGRSRAARRAKVPLLRRWKKPGFRERWRPNRWVRSSTASVANQVTSHPAKFMCSPCGWSVNAAVGPRNARGRPAGVRLRKRLHVSAIRAFAVSLPDSRSDKEPNKTSLRPFAVGVVMNPLRTDLGPSEHLLEGSLFAAPVMAASGDSLPFPSLTAHGRNWSAFGHLGRHTEHAQLVSTSLDHPR